MAAAAKCFATFGSIARVSVSRMCPTNRTKLLNGIVFTSRRLCTVTSVNLNNNVFNTTVKTPATNFYTSSLVLGCISKINPLLIEFDGSSSTDLVEGLNADDEGDTWSLHRTSFKIM